MTVREDKSQYKIVKAEDGSAATRVFICDWTEKDNTALSPRIPILGDALDGSSEVLVVRRIEQNKIPSASGDKCLTTVEYSTPRPGAQQEETPTNPANNIPTVAPVSYETLTGGGEYIDVKGLKYDWHENVVLTDVKMFVPHDEYRITILYSQDHNDYIKTFVGSVNQQSIGFGYKIMFTGAAETLLFESYEISPEYKKVTTNDVDSYIMKYKTTFVFKRRLIPWTYCWRNPEPFLDRQGKPYVYGKEKPFEGSLSATWRVGQIVYGPVKNEGGNYVLDFSGIGWQRVGNPTINPLTGKAYNTPIYPAIDWRTNSPFPTE